MYAQQAGVKDMRFQALMPDILHWFGIQKVRCPGALRYSYEFLLTLSNHTAVDRRHGVLRSPLTTSRFALADVLTPAQYSMSDMKHDAIVNSGISIGNRHDLPSDLIPPDSQVEIQGGSPDA